MTHGPEVEPGRSTFIWLACASVAAAIAALSFYTLMLANEGFYIVTSPPILLLGITAIGTGVIALRQRAAEHGSGLAVIGVVAGAFQVGFLLVEPVAGSVHAILGLIGGGAGLVIGLITALVLKPARVRPIVATAPGAIVIPETSGLAVASMVLGIVGFWILALIFGYLARGQIRRSNGTQRGDGFAIAGIVLGWVGFVLVCGLVLLVLLLNAADSDLGQGR